MKILLLLNHDIHSARAALLLMPHLKSHQIDILLSRKVGNLEDVGGLLSKIRKVESENVEELYQKIAENLKCKIEFVEKINSAARVEKLRKLAPQLIISIRFGQILRKEVIEIPVYGVINLHSGILPQYRGVMASLWAILQLERQIGTTLHYIEDAAIDMGRIIAFSKREVDFTKTLVENIHALYDAGCLDIIEFVRKLEAGEKIPLIDQKTLGQGRYYSYPTVDDLERCAALIKLF